MLQTDARECKPGTARSDLAESVREQFGSKLLPKTIVPELATGSVDPRANTPQLDERDILRESCPYPFPALG